MTTYSTPIAIPAIPSKFDVIPIHASDRGTFKQCRRRWNWSSPMRNNLVPKASEGGVYFPLWFGSGVHWALRYFYDPLLQRDPVETFKTWWDIQWNGGVITEDWLEVTYDRKPQQVPSKHAGTDMGIDEVIDYRTEPVLYKVKGLYDILPAPDIDKFEDHRELGIGMLTFYKEYASKNDNFDVIAAEHTFSVPIHDNNDEPLLWQDPRDGEMKEVHLRGTQDAIIRDRDSGMYGILEHKTAVSIDEEYREKLDKDEQCTTYMYAGEREARMHDLPYVKIDFVLYNALRKAFPKPPTITSRGDISRDRSKESTTYEMLMQAIEELGMSDFWQQDDKLAAYVNYVKDAGDEQFIVRDYVRRNRQEIESCGNRVLMEALDMLDNPRIYPNPTGHYSCLRCPFRAPCIAADDGSDWRLMIEDGFDRNWTR